MPASSWRSTSNSECSMISKPSAYACISPYSIPLCTIFVKWPAPGCADVRIAVLGRERGEDRLEALHRLVVAADHQAEAYLAAPRCRRRRRRRRSAGPSRSPRRVPPLRVMEVRVAAVDDRVALLGELQQLLEGVLRDLPCRDHHPERARRVELRLQLLERCGGARLDRGVVRANVVVVLAQPVGHSVAHAAEADHSELHWTPRSPRYGFSRRAGRAP